MGLAGSQVYGKGPVTDVPVRAVVTFCSSAFVTEQPDQDFIHPAGFGDDVARWLIDRLRQRGTRTVDEPRHEDFAWCFDYWVRETVYRFVIGYQPGDHGEAGQWVGWIERKAGLMARLHGRRRRGIVREAAMIIHTALADAPGIHNLSWHDTPAFDGEARKTGFIEP